MSDTRTVLHSKVREAEKAYKALETQMQTEARAAADAVRASYSDRLNALSEDSRAARIALQACIDAEASHEWEGQQVFRMVDKSSRWAREPNMQPVFGIVEVRRSGTEFPANISYGLPDQGQAFVRLLNKDGKPGLKLDKWNWRVDGWQLVANLPAEHKQKVPA